MAVCLRTDDEFAVKVLKFHVRSDPPFEHCGYIIGWLTSEGITVKKLDLHGVDLKNIADPVIAINIPPTTNFGPNACC
jgi:hypothetical protein